MKTDIVQSQEVPASVVPGRKIFWSDAHDVMGWITDNGELYIQARTFFTNDESDRQYLRDLRAIIAEALETEPAKEERP